MGFHTLSIGKTALLTAQYALNITGHNMANAATDGYSRQIVNSQALVPQGWGFGSMGLGVEISQIRRVSDAYLEGQLRNAYSRSEFYNTLDTCYLNLDIFFNELSETDISTSLDNFFDSLDDWNSHIESVSHRVAVLESAQSLAERFNMLGKQLFNYREQVNLEIQGYADDVNRLAQTIARLNVAIGHMEGGGMGRVVANDLRDQRDEALKKLAGLIDIHVVEEPNGNVIVRQANRTLVYANVAHEVTTRQVHSYDQLVDVLVWASDGTPLQPNDGKLGALVKMRDEVLYGFQKDVDALAQTVMWEMNRIHSQSAGLAPMQRVQASIAPFRPDEFLDAMSYTFPFPRDIFAIQNGTMDIIVYDMATQTEKTVTVEIDLDRRQNPLGELDTILWDPNHPEADHSLVNKIQRALDGAAPGVFRAGVDAHNFLYIESLSEDFGFGFGADTSGVLAALGINTLFSGYNATSMKVDPAIRNNPELLAGARGDDQSPAYVSGNNNGALALLRLRSEAVMGRATVTIDGFYQALVGRLGVESARIMDMAETQNYIFMRTMNTREELSGVSMDEELTRLIQYQRSFQSASKFISITDQLYETLINM